MTAMASSDRKDPNIMQVRGRRWIESFQKQTRCIMVYVKIVNGCHENQYTRVAEF